MEKNIDISALFHEILKKLWLIVLMVVIFAVASMTYTSLAVQPKYKSTTSFFLLTKSNENSQAISYYDVEISTKLVGDCEYIIKSHEVMNVVIKKLDLNMTSSQLASSITVSSSTDTRILEISVVNSDPKLAQSIANEVREVADDRIISVMGIDSVNVVDKATLPSAPFSPNVRNNTIFGGLLGLALSLIIIFLIVICNNDIKTIDDVEKHLGLEVLGVIPSQRHRRR